MAEFLTAFEKMIRHEGGWVNDPDDPGAETYKGVSRKYFGKWTGWVQIDLAKSGNGFPGNLERNRDLQTMVRTFYEEQFWDRMRGDQIENQAVADLIFDFGVNAGIQTAVAVAQMVAGAKADGVVGPKTLELLNRFDPDHFLAAYSLARIARYAAIVKKRPASRKFFYGWICRALGETQS